jgi:hypothetical protein
MSDEYTQIKEQIFTRLEIFCFAFKLRYCSVVVRWNRHNIAEILLKVALNSTNHHTLVGIVNYFHAITLVSQLIILKFLHTFLIIFTQMKIVTHLFQNKMLTHLKFGKVWFTQNFGLLRVPKKTNTTIFIISSLHLSQTFNEKILIFFYFQYLK